MTFRHFYIGTKNNDWLLTATCVSNWYLHLPLLSIIKRTKKMWWNQQKSHWIHHKYSHQYEKVLKFKLFNDMLCFTNQSVWIDSWCPHPEIDNDLYIRSTKPCNDWEINIFLAYCKMGITYWSLVRIHKDWPKLCCVSIFKLHSTYQSFVKKTNGNNYLAQAYNKRTLDTRHRLSCLVDLLTFNRIFSWVSVPTVARKFHINVRYFLWLTLTRLMRDRLTWVS